MNAKHNGGDELPPHDTEAEAGALGSIINAGGRPAVAMLDKLCIEAFYDLRHKEIFRALSWLTAAILEWHKRTFESHGLRYYGQLLDRVVYCSDFAIWIPWAG
jgi:replicative DNA helicase